MENLKKWIREAENGNVDAMIQVANTILWEDETSPVEPDRYEMAVSYLKKAIEAGNTEAMISYGAVFYNGRGVPQDFRQAVHWYRQAADRGNQWAICYMGYMYYYGRGDLDVDMEMAYRYYSKAAMLGVPNAYYKCGDMFLLGQYVTRDVSTAFELYWKCYSMVRASQPMDCYPDVCRRLGTCFHKGLGTEKDLVQAEHLLFEARRLFQKRLNEGDRFTGEVLRQATQEWEEIMREMGEDPAEDREKTGP